MSDYPASLVPDPALPPPGVFPVKGDSTFAVRRSWKVALAVAGLMLVLALIGVGLTTTDRTIAPMYWVSLVPVYGLLCVATACVRSRHGQASRSSVLRQVLHWLGIAGALAIDFRIRRSGEETGVAAGFTALLLLALGCFLAGVHLEWLFTIVGLLLTAIVLIVVKADQYLWLIVIAGGIGVVALIWLLRRIERGRARRPTSVGP